MRSRAALGALALLAGWLASSGVAVAQSTHTLWGAAWPGATVRIVGCPVAAEPWIGPRVELAIETDARGRFRCDLPIGIDCVAWAERIDAAAVATLSRPARALSPLVLRPDGATRPPIAIRVQGLTPWAELGPFELRLVARELAAATRSLALTSDGVFHLPALPADVVVELVDRRGIPVFETSVGTAGARLLLPMPALRRLSVRDAAGRGGRAAVLAAQPWRRAVLGVTDEDGHLSFVVPPADSTRVRLAVARRDTVLAPVVGQRGGPRDRNPFVTDSADLSIAPRFTATSAVTLSGARLAVFGGLRARIAARASRIVPWCELVESASGAPIEPAGKTAPALQFDCGLVPEHAALLLSTATRAALPEAWAGIPWRTAAPMAVRVDPESDHRGLIELAPLRLAIRAPDGMPAAGAAVDLFVDGSLVGSFHGDADGHLDLLAGAVRRFHLLVRWREVVAFAEVDTGRAMPRREPSSLVLQLHAPVRVSGTVAAGAGQRIELAPTRVESPTRASSVDSTAESASLHPVTDAEVFAALLAAAELRLAGWSDGEGRFEFRLPRIAPGWTVTGPASELEVPPEGGTDLRL